MTTTTVQLDEALARADREGWRDWVRNVQDEHAVAEGCTFDIGAAERVAEFFRRFLRLPNPRANEPGQPKTIPFELIPWQWEHVVAPLFGWKRPDGSRRFRYAWVEVSKKNGKSPLAAGIVLALLVIDGEVDPEIYSAATTREQAGIVFKEARKMVDRSPALQRVLEIREHVKRITNPKAMGFYAVLANKPAAVDGINAHGLVIDEIHRMPKRDLYDALVYSTDARRQPVQFIITTAGTDRESIGYELHDRAEKIAAGIIVDTSTLVYIAAADPDDDAGDPETWRKANPSLGVTIQEADLAAEYERAKDSPARMLNFRRLRLNQWTGRVSQWLDYDRWLACGIDIDPADYEGRECWAGLDLSGTNDITALVLVFPSADGTRDILPFFWLPEDTLLDHEKQAGVPYRAWAEAGELETTSGDFIDFDFIRRRIVELGQRYRITELSYDPKFAQQIATQLQSEGFEVFEFWQRRTMTNPVLRHMERLVLERRLRHGNHPVLNWMASNVEVDENADGLIKTIKPKDSRKIDGIDAISFALGNDVKPAEDDQHDYYHDYPFAFA